MKQTQEAKYPLAPYYGGKWRLAPWVLSFMPRHELYVEPFGGMGSVLFLKSQSKGEVYNDADGSLVNLFRVIRDKGKCAELSYMLSWSLTSRDDYIWAWEHKNDEALSDVKRAWCKLYDLRFSYRGGGKRGVHSPSGWTGSCVKARKMWDHHYPEKLFVPGFLAPFHARFASVTIEHKDALECIRYYSNTCHDTVFYLDPPYYGVHGYDIEFSRVSHEALATQIKDLSHKVLLSGYDNEVYRDILKDWRVENRRHFCRSHLATTEFLWINPAADEALRADEAGQPLTLLGVKP